MLGGAGTAAAVALMLADLPLAGLVAAGLGILGLVWGWVGPRWNGPASGRPGGPTSAVRRERLRERIAYRREVDRRHAADVERRARAAAAVREAAQRAGVAAGDSERQVERLLEWHRRWRSGRSDVERRGAEWDLLQQLLAGRSPTALGTEARARRAEAAARSAGVGEAALAAARTAATPDRLAEEERAAATARGAADAERGRLEHVAADLPSLVDAEEELVAATREVERLERLDRTLATTIAFLERAEERVHRDLAPVLRATVRERLPRVTGGRYADCRVDPQSLRVEVRDGTGEWRRAELLSHGTAEQIYLLLRLALARHLAASGEVCPLILDDAVAACDADRKRALLDTLHAISESAQVILFTHEEDVREWARERLTDPRDRLTALPPATTPPRRDGEEESP